MLKKFLETPNDNKIKTIAVVAVLCLVCSIFVSASAVALKPIQQKNKQVEKKTKILEIAGLMELGGDVDELFKQFTPKVVELATGEYVDDIDPATYDQRKAAKKPELSVLVSRSDDIASIKRQAKYATVYLVKQDEQVKKIVIPVHGYGLWSTLYGYMALDGDGKTVTGFGFYEHAETPGLGGEVDNPKWKGLWPGKVVYGENGDVQLRVVKGNVDPSKPGSEHKVDGLAGATLTSQGVSNLVQFWLGENGFGPYLEKFIERNG